MKRHNIILSFFSLLLCLSFVLVACDRNDEPGIVSIDGLEYTFSDPAEWNVTPSENFRFSYSVTADSGAPASVRIEVKGVSPDRSQSWTAVKLIQDTHVGRKYVGILEPEERPAPGFYQCEAFINGTSVRKFNIACDLEKYVVPSDSEADFDEFWTRALADLDKVPIEAEIEKVDHLETDGSLVYMFTIRSASDTTGDDITISGWYKEPKRSGKAPLIVFFQGYDDESSPVSMSPTFPFNSEFAQIIVYTRGQGLNRRHPKENRYGKWDVFGLDSPETYYYRGAYLDAARTIQFARTLEKVDERNIAVKGGSQGGALALAAAALCPDQISSAIVAFPFMGHFPVYLETAKWHASDILSYADLKSISRPDLLRTLSYFDSKNMARKVKCPVLLQMTLQDHVCPPWTQFPIFCNLQSKSTSEWSVDVTSGHVGSTERNAASTAFMKNHFVP